MVRFFFLFGPLKKNCRNSFSKWRGDHELSYRNEKCVADFQVTLSLKTHILEWSLCDKIEKRIKIEKHQICFSLFSTYLYLIYGIAFVHIYSIDTLSNQIIFCFNYTLDKTFNARFTDVRNTKWFLRKILDILCTCCLL